MELIAAFIIFIVGIFVHEVSHIFIAWYFSKEIPSIRFRKIGIMIIPKSVYTNIQKQMFLAYPIITGMISIAIFNFHYPIASSLALVAYFISCGADFYNLIKIEVKK